MNCIICGYKADKHHVKSRGSGGGDEAWNLCALCRMHHTEIHMIGISKMKAKYEIFQRWLSSHGWYLDPTTRKYRHD